jgi:DNA/RNA endonuclease G (NUC1)
MMSVEELERLTGFTFFANVPNAPKSKANATDWGL